MKLEKIEINGFKSFAEKTEILLDGEITGIVGPNGSGKSNIADAVRWVLGEQNSRSLRGAKMEDVIFGGTQSRKPKAYCEVSLSFDNTDQRINTEYSQIVITRKMFRSGESEYYLNHIPVRLKDILDIVRDTGIGREGYSIVGQGKIDEILSAKPGARRKVFEEAAGVMKFRTRKEEAENKLQKTQDNLVRIGDILEELYTQIGPLSEQAEKTKTYLTLFERQKYLDANIFLVNHERVQKRLDKLKNDLQELEKQIWQDKSRFGDVTQQSEELAERLKLIEKDISFLREQYEQTVAAAEQAGTERNVASERLAATQKDIVRLSEEQKAMQKRKENLKLQKEQAEKRLSDLLKQTDQISCQIVQQKDLCEEEQRQQAEHRQQLQQIRQRHLALLEQQNILERSLATIHAKKEGMEASVMQLQSRLQFGEEQFLHNEALKRELGEKVNDLNKQIARIKTDLQENREQAIQVRQQQKQNEQQLGKNRVQCQEMVSRKRFLEKLKQEYEGYAQGVKNLMLEIHRQPKSFYGVLGTLAELIGISKDYEKALEAALGAALQNIVVQTDEDAKAAIELLRKKKLGRVSFMPLQSLKIRMLSDREERLLGEGMLRADQVVQCSEQVRSAVEFLLARTVIVENMDVAIALAKKSGHTFRIVTLEGDLINPGGIITGGSMQKRNFGLLGRDREIEQCTNLARLYEQKTQELQEQNRKLSDRVEEMEHNNECLSTKLKETEIIQVQYQTQWQNAQQQAIALQEEQQKNKVQLQDIEQNSNYSEEQTMQLQLQLQKIKLDLQQIVELQEQLQQREEQQEKTAQQRLGELQVQEARLQGEVQRNKEMLESISQEQRDTENNIYQKRQEQENLVEQRKLLASDEQEYAHKQQHSKQNAEKLRIKVEQEEAQRMMTNEQLAQMQRRGTEYQMRQAEMAEGKYKLESQIERLSLSMENAQNKLWDDYGMTYGEAESFREEINYAQSTRELQEIREKIRVLGSINPNAVEDYNRVYARTKEMAAQKEDLEKAKIDLEALIRNILASMKIVFSEKFQQINKNFGEIFHELFGGGHASISLMEGDIMECGIEISAEPPGKKLQHISLLSGGERALTGIALLFAMIRINPAPLCLLDEIDAPLDEANVVRFGNYIKKIPDSQFLIITHRKPTMAICQVLFGVTMEEKGVSKLVSVKIEEQE